MSKIYVALDIGAQSRNGLFEITDISPDEREHSAKVTVRELMGGGSKSMTITQAQMIRGMRDLAKRAVPEFKYCETYPIERGSWSGSQFVTFKLTGKYFGKLPYVEKKG